MLRAAPMAAAQISCSGRVPQGSTAASRWTPRACCSARRSRASAAWRTRAAIDARHGAWSAQLPKDTAGLWDVLCGLDSDSRQALFAHCVGLTINATCQPYDRRPKAIAHADRVAEAVRLDMAEAGWRPTVAAYLGRVT